tara:strand:- start:328 stop:708 length:381 start_codon:yes stop_codon:yes gene_type:complete
MFMLSCGEDTPSDNFSFKNEACNQYIEGLKNYQAELEKYDQAYTQYIEDVKNSDMTSEEIAYTLKMINEERKKINAELQEQQIQIKEEINNREAKCVCINNQLKDINTLEITGESIDKMVEQCLDE